MAKSQPVFNAPNVVLATIVALAAVHLGREFLDPAQEEWLLLVGAFIPARYAGQALPGGDVAKITSFVTHMGLHGDYAHLAVNCGWMLAFGSILGRRIGTVRFLALSVLAMDPGSSGVLCLEEPENGIHPARLPDMLALLKGIACNITQAVCCQSFQYNFNCCTLLAHH